MLAVLEGTAFIGMSCADMVRADGAFCVFSPFDRRGMVIDSLAPRFTVATLEVAAFQIGEIAHVDPLAGLNY
jgi:hypothetical protein